MSTYKIYTDGAASNNGTSKAIGGWAFVILKNNEKLCENFGKEVGATNNQMELTAAINGLDTFYSVFIPSDFDIIEVYTDSAYLCNAYKEKWYSNWQANGWKTSNKHDVLNKDLWLKLIPYFNTNNITFKKVKGHNGDKYNDYVDQLAVAGRQL